MIGIDSTNPFAVIVHRDFTGDVDTFLSRTGCHFDDALYRWRNGRDEWLLLACHTPACLKAYKPVVFHCIDYQELKVTIRQCIDECGPPIEWRVCVVPGSYPREVLGHVLPADRTTWHTLDHVWSEATLRDVEARRAEKAKAAKRKGHQKYVKAKKKRAVIARIAKKAAKTKAATKRTRKAAKKRQT